MRRLKKVNVPNEPKFQSQPNKYRTINKRKIRRFVLAFIFLFSATVYIQCILNKQQEMIQEKQSTIKSQQKQLTSLEKAEYYLKNEVGNLTDNEEEILKFARKEYQFSKPNETIFILPK
ncbi:FtsB family cell division protein [Bacillus gaemokensis]|uniref:Cell division protein DIVIC n=1 Tax=Bacillus gaemokensis TaxID=574375 RepID=A0A073K9H1_9BACI|nr:septum formation initiator family protein [Bacillus gaemokensis]KEK23097.1 cell division protein DIVIC [Bacillus gaemokensis]KYG37564.1 cell division protein DIVIC [Bacillus gaemokensis]